MDALEILPTAAPMRGAAPVPAGGGFALALGGVLAAQGMPAAGETAPAAGVVTLPSAGPVLAAGATATPAPAMLPGFAGQPEAAPPTPTALATPGYLAPETAGSEVANAAEEGGLATSLPPLPESTGAEPIEASPEDDSEEVAEAPAPEPSTPVAQPADGLPSLAQPPAPSAPLIVVPPSPTQARESDASPAQLATESGVPTTGAQLLPVTPRPEGAVPTRLEEVAAPATANTTLGSSSRAHPGKARDIGGAEGTDRLSHTIATMPAESGPTTSSVTASSEVGVAEGASRPSALDDLASPAGLQPASAAVTATPQVAPQAAAQPMPAPVPLPLMPTPAAPPPEAPARFVPRVAPSQQVAPVAIALALGGGPDGMIALSLDPVELGRVEVTVERVGEATRVQVSAERPETLALLARDGASLDRALGGAGIGGDGGRSLSFSLLGGETGGGGAAMGGGTQEGGRQSGGRWRGAPSGMAEEADPRRQALLGLLDIAI